MELFLPGTSDPDKRDREGDYVTFHFPFHFQFFEIHVDCLLFDVLFVTSMSKKTTNVNFEKVKVELFVKLKISTPLIFKKNL